MYLGRNHVAIPISGIQGRINSGSFTASRPNINFIQGSNVTLSINDDAGDDEIEITISSGLPSHTHPGSQVGLQNNVANGISSGSGSGNFTPANQVSVKLGFCFSVAGNTSLDMIGFGATKGTGSNQGTCTVDISGGGFTLNTPNGALWSGGGYSGSTTVFSGTNWTIFFSNGGGGSTGIYATSIGWT